MRCAVCGSKRVSKEIKKEGYNTKKGIIGSILFGTSGAIIGGSSGKENIYYHCADCGHVLNQPMDSTTQMKISTHLQHPEIFESELKKEKERYPNIEWTQQESLKKTEEELIIETMLELGRPVTVKDIVEHNPLLNSHQKVISILIEMRHKNQIRREEIGSQVYFSLIRGEDDNVERSSSKQKEPSRTVENLNTEDKNKKRKEVVLETLEDIGKATTIEEIQSHKNILLADDTLFSCPQIVSAILTQLKEENKVKREQIGPKAYYSLIKKQ